ncbi:Oxidoreductase molybdopterin binding domain-containing protein [Chitinophaga rupis]|uniref:Oxidoreductase molybdopterin binding domain-containing protein n=1 Tax=Chitinophaga rupis TaxID=573321 RepID=A0A1H7T0R8_9BACT|nr:molybdopterin-dependent oxidoreductase [Chitinophaga rupis]SEL78510.1 Oxidoreductase molybdopterin binding domain-containing protein [Chitinophaga rupis]
MQQANHKKNKPELTVQQKINRRNFISFTTFFVVGGALFGGWKWLYHAPEETPGITAGASKPLRRALNKTELFFRRIFSNNHPVKTYPKRMAAKQVRVNGDIGIDDKGFNPQTWQLAVIKSQKETLQLSLDEIRALPKSDLVFDFKCVEGWDQIQHWAGVKFSDFIAHYGLQDQARMQYVGMATPNEEYYVGLDMASALHPQTLLAYEMNEQPLRPEHGAPLRLIIPVKYGIKNLKRIGTISFSNERPPDYWAEQGYDYYSGL